MRGLFGLSFLLPAALVAAPTPAQAQQRCAPGAVCVSVPPTPACGGDKACMLLPGRLRLGEPPGRTPSFPPRPALPRNTVPQSTSRARTSGIMTTPAFGGFYPAFPVYSPYGYGYATPVVDETTVNVIVNPSMTVEDLQWAFWNPPSPQPTQAISAMVDSVIAHTAQSYISIVDPAIGNDRRVFQRIIGDMCGTVLYADCTIRFWGDARKAPAEGVPTAEQVKAQTAEFRYIGATGSSTFHFMKDGKPITP